MGRPQWPMLGLELYIAVATLRCGDHGATGAETRNGAVNIARRRFDGMGRAPDGIGSAAPADRQRAADEVGY